MVHSIVIVESETAT